MSGEMTAKEYLLGKLDDREKMFYEITRLTEKEKQHYVELLNVLKTVNDNRANYTDKEKGDALENIVSFILEKSAVFTVYRNLHTSTNEVDQLITFNKKGAAFREYIKINGEYFISECKNYDGTIGVTWVGKFFSLLSVQACKVGVLFSYYGLTGRGWNDGTGLTKKLFLLRERIEDRISIIDFNINDFDRIEQGGNFLDIIESKMLSLITDTNFNHFITAHPAEEECG